MGFEEDKKGLPVGIKMITSIEKEFVFEFITCSSFSQSLEVVDDYLSNPEVPEETKLKIREIREKLIKRNSKRLK